MKTKQNITLGSRELGEVSIQAISHNWKEFPTRIKDKLKTDKSLYLKLDPENFNKFSEFYRDVVSGDNSEGISSKVSTYYKLMFVRDNGKELTSLYFKSLYPEFDNYHLSDMPDNLTYIVEVH